MLQSWARSRRRKSQLIANRRRAISVETLEPRAMLAGDLMARDDLFAFNSATFISGSAIPFSASVLGNDSGTALSAVLDETTTDGVLSLAADGTFTYTPPSNFDGFDSFTYIATDGEDDSEPVQVTLVDSANGAFLVGLYRDVLGRAPDEGGFAGWRSALNNGLSRTSVVEGFLSSEEFRNRLVESLFEHYLGRSPNSSELAAQSGALASGTSEIQIHYNLIANNEYYNLQGINDVDFLTGLYQDVLGREPDEGGLSGWYYGIQFGQITRSDAVWGFLNSQEFREKWVGELYQEYLGREADNGGRHHFAGVLGSGNARGVRAGLLASDEYFNRTPIFEQSGWIKSMGSPGDFTVGTGFTLSAQLSNGPEAVESVSFYRDVDGNSILDTVIDELLGTDTDGSDGWSVTSDATAWLTGETRFFARSELASGPGPNTPLAVSTLRPVNPFTGIDAPGSVLRGESITLTAQGTAGSGVQSVSFYRDKNGDGILQLGTDILLGTDTSATDGWSVQIATTAFPRGQSRFLMAVNDGRTNSVAIASSGTQITTDAGFQGTPPAADPNATIGGYLFTFVFADSDYTDSVSVYHADRADGGILVGANWVVPGDLGYAGAAAGRAKALFSNSADIGTQVAYSFPAGAYLGYIAHVINTGRTYYSFSAADPEGDRGHMGGSAVSSGATVVGLEDLRRDDPERPVDGDFNDLVFLAQPIVVDIDTTIADPQEADAPGVLFNVNDDDDNGNGTPDFDILENGEVEGENDLVPVAIRSLGVTATSAGKISAKLMASGNIKVWKDATKKEEIFVEGNSRTWDIYNQTLPATVYVEGRDIGASSLTWMVTAISTSMTPDFVALTAVKIDIDTDSNNSGAIDPDNTAVTGTDDPIEYDTNKPGRLLVVNDDDDNGDGIADLTAPQGNQATLVTGENDLAEVLLRPMFTAPSFGQYRAKLIASGPIKLWNTADKTTAVEFDLNTGIASWDLAGEGPPPSIWVEGLDGGSVTIEYWLDGPGSSYLPHDLIKLTVLSVDLDIDSNNDGMIGSDDDAIENSSVLSGKWMPLNSRDTDGDGVPGFADGIKGLSAGSTQVNSGLESDRKLVPVRVAIPAQIDLNGVQIRFVGVSSGDPLTTAMSIPFSPPASDTNIRLWTDAGIDILGQSFRESKDPAVADLQNGGGHWVPGGMWLSADQLGFDADNRTRNFYVEGLYNSISKGQEILTLEVKPAYSTGSQFIVRDTVRATVIDVDIDIGSVLTGNVLTGDVLVDEASDQSEETSGNVALIPVNSADRDFDTHRNYVDGFDWPSLNVPLQGAGNPINGGVNASRDFTPIDIEVSAAIDLTSATLVFAYDDSDPRILNELGGVLSPSGGQLRLWNVNGSSVRDASSVIDSPSGNYIPANTSIPASILGLVGSTRRVRLYLEGIHESISGSHIRATVNPEGQSLIHNQIDDVANYTVGDVLIEGRIEYSAADQRSPVRFAKIELIDEAGFDTVVAEGFTDIDGRYVLHLDSVPAASTYALVVYAQSVEDAVVGYGSANRTVHVDLGSTPYEWRKDVSIRVPTTGIRREIIDLAGMTAIGSGRSTFDEHTTEEKAFWVYDAAVTAMLFQMELPGTQQGDVVVTYPAAATATDSNKVGIAEPAARKWDEIIHEYGHKVAFENGFGLVTSNTATNHFQGYNLRGTYPNEEAEYLLQFGFDEGWANFYSMAAQKFVPVASLVDFSIDGARYLGSSIENPSPASSTPGGEDEEDAVMRILWDLMDEANESTDTVSLGMPALFDIIKNNGTSGGRILNDVWRALTEGTSATEQQAYAAIFETMNVAPTPLEIRVNDLPTTNLTSSDVPAFIFQIPRGSQANSQLGVDEVGRLFDKFSVRVEGGQGLAYEFSNDDLLVQTFGIVGQGSDTIIMMPDPTSWQNWLNSHIGESLSWTSLGRWSESPGTSPYFRRSTQTISVSQ